MTIQDAWCSLWSSAGEQFIASRCNPGTQPSSYSAPTRLLQNEQSWADAGFGKGGYFAARACSGNSDRLAVCIVNPPPVPANLIASQYFEPLLVQKYYDPVAYAGQYNASTLPDGYAAAFTNTSDILDTLLYTCNASSGAADLLAQAYEEPNGFTSYSDGEIPVSCAVVSLQLKPPGSVGECLAQHPRSVWVLKLTGGEEMLALRLSSPLLFGPGRKKVIWGY